MDKYKQEKLRKHLSDALDILWVHYGNGFGTEKEKLISEIQLEVERLDSANASVRGGAVATYPARSVGQGDSNAG